MIKVRTGLPKGSRQRLMLAFYTMIPPLRCDLNRVGLLQCPASAATISPDEVDAVKENNFLCLPADRKKPAILVLTEFKTANSAGVWRRTLPMNLTRELWTSLQAERLEDGFSLPSPTHRTQQRTLANGAILCCKRCLTDR